MVEVDNFTQTLIYSLPPELANRLSFLITILQAVGIMVIIYLVFNVINWRINKRKRRELTEINNNLKDIKKLLQGNFTRSKK